MLNVLSLFVGIMLVVMGVANFMLTMRSKDSGWPEILQFTYTAVFFTLAFYLIRFGVSNEW